MRECIALTVALIITIKQGRIGTMLLAIQRTMVLTRLIRHFINKKGLPIKPVMKQRFLYGNNKVLDLSCNI